MNTLLLASIASIATVAGAGWGANAYLNDTFADKPGVMVVQAQMQFVLDRQMAAISNDIGYLERKGNLTPSELDRLRYLRQQLDEMRRVRSGR